MAPTTRSTNRETTPDKPIEVGEFDTVEKSRFFEAYDARPQGQSMREFSKSSKVSKTTASRWLKERNKLGSPAYRRMRKRSKILGPREKLERIAYKMLVSPSRNPVRDQQYEAQIEYHHLRVAPRTI